ncbi:MAG: FadR/GntR family transcriptional regulator [Tistlia sp.]|uniref:FadR/GntR family transcriptional regulator n=1 Tax=Tistlia sp. TaxID=3057121 RepID=UPI0034A0EB71
MATDRYQQTLTALLQLIESDALDVGGRLPTERELSETFGVGRRILRRALAELEAQGRILRHQGRGTFVVGREAAPAAGGASAGPEAAALLPFDLANPVELIELRLALEPVMARLAAIRSSRLEVEELRELAERTARADNHVGYQQADAALHRRIAELSRNSLFVTLHEGVGRAMQDSALARFGENGHCFKRQAQHASFHKAIVEAIAARDCQRAESLMHDHLSDVHQSLFVDSLPAGYARRQAAE